MTVVQDAVDAITAEINTAAGTITTEIAALQAVIDAGGAPDLTALQAAADSLAAISTPPAPAPVEPSA